MKHELWKCVSCGNLFLWRNQGHNIELKNCPHCTLNKWIECTDLQLVLVDKSCDCDMITRILKKQKAEAEDKSREGERNCYVCSQSYPFGRGVSCDNSKCDGKTHFTPKPKPRPEPQPSLQQQIDAIKDQLDALATTTASLQDKVSSRDKEETIKMILTRLDELEKKTADNTEDCFYPYDNI